MNLLLQVNWRANAVKGESGPGLHSNISSINQALHKRKSESLEDYTTLILDETNSFNDEKPIKVERSVVDLAARMTYSISKTSFLPRKMHHQEIKFH